MKRIIFLLVIYFASTSSILEAAGLNGPYSIDPKSKVARNFVSFNSAIRALTKNGISGPVVFYIADGKYNNSIWLKPIKGVSATNTIVFESLSRDSSKVTLDTTYATNSSSSPGFTLKIASDYVSFRHMTIRNSATKLYSDVIQIAGNYVHIENCILNAPLSQKDSCGVLNISGAGDTIANNIIKGSHSGIYLSFGGGGEIAIQNNHFDSSYHSAMYFNYTGKSLIEKNVINIPSPERYGIYFFNSECSGGMMNMWENRVRDNFITGDNANGYGIYVHELDYSYSYFYHIIFNNIYVKGTPIYILSTDTFLGNSSVGNLYVFYNIFHSYGGNVAMFISDTSRNSSPELLIDHNNLYSKGAKYIAYYNSYYSSPKAFTTATGLNAHWKNVAPAYRNVATTDLHIDKTTDSLLQDSGIMTYYSPYDFDDEARNYKKTTIGADMYNPRDSMDVGVNSILNAFRYLCGKDSDFITLKIKNYSSTDTIGHFWVKLKVKGAVSDSFSLFIPNVLQPLGDTLLSFVPGKKWNSIKNSGKYLLDAYTILKGDQITTNNEYKAFLFTNSPLPYIKYNRTCLSDTVQFLDSLKSGHLKIQSSDWDFGDGSTHSALINPSHKYLSNGVFSVNLSVMDTLGCYDSAHVNIRIIDTAAVHIAGPGSYCSDSTGAYTVTGDSATSYTWHINNGNIISSNGNDSIQVKWNRKDSGFLRVVTGYPGCKCSSFMGINIDTNCLITGLTQTFPVNQHVLIYPNPAFAELNIEFNDKNADRIRVLNLTGACLLDYKTGGSETIKLDIRDLISGMYIVEVISKNGLYRQKITVNKN